jgi:light-regulated signal transduction histidine kinase (bacteriophytochrome)
MDQNIILDKLKKAKQELIFNHEELERCTNDLKIANVNLNIKETEKELNMEEFNSGLEQMMFAISHKVRKSVANILGLSKLLCEDVNLGNSELREILLMIIQSAESLNTSTEELSKFICLKRRTDL